MPWRLFEFKGQHVYVRVLPTGKPIVRRSLVELRYKLDDKRLERLLSTVERRLNDPAVDADSLTPWVRHPAELNTYWDLALPMDPALAAARKPNRVRYQVIFDRGAPYGDVIEGLTHLGIRADLD